MLLADAASTRKTERRPQPANQGKQPVRPTRSPPQLGRTGSPPRPGGGSSGSPPIYSKQYTLRTKEELIAAGVLGPLMNIITAHSDSSSSVPVAACSCACVTLGLIAPQSSEQVIAAGGVPVLLSALKHASMAEYAALALSGLAENNASATAAAIAATDGGYAPLVALLDDGAVAVEAVDALA